MKKTPAELKQGMIVRLDKSKRERIVESIKGPDSMTGCYFVTFEGDTKANAWYPPKYPFTLTALGKRNNGIATVVELALDPENGFQVRPEISVGKLVKAIRDLRSLGRTRRWDLVLTRWENMVLECDEHDAHSNEWNRILHWAIIQGSTYAFHAAA